MNSFLSSTKSTNGIIFEEERFPSEEVVGVNQPFPSLARAVARSKTQPRNCTAFSPKECHML